MPRSRLVVGAVAVAIVLVSSASGSAGSQQARWVITDLGTLGGKESDAVAINGRGEVVGNSVTKTGDARAFLWRSGRMRDLGTLGGESSSVGAINDRGQVVGTAETKIQDKDGLEDGLFVAHAFLWQNGKMTDLGTLGGSYSDATGINERGQVVGTADTNARDEYGALRANVFLWRNGKMRDLGIRFTGKPPAINDRGLIGGTRRSRTHDKPYRWKDGRVTDLETLSGLYGGVVAINERGQIVGESDIALEHNGAARHAVLWQNGTLRDLGVLRGDTDSAAVTVDDGGRIIGESWSAESHSQPADAVAFVWANGRRSSLGTLGGVESYAWAINGRGEIVGGTTTGAKNEDGSPVWRAFRWQNGTMTDLGTLGGKQSYAIALNESGQIAGWATTKTGARHAVIWTLRRS